MRPNLVINVGIRWETTLPPTGEKDNWSDFDPNLANPGAGGRKGALIYAGTGNNFDGGSQQMRGAGIYRSLDAGETWTQLSAPFFIGKEIVRIVVPAPNVLLVATNNVRHLSSFVDARRWQDIPTQDQ